jgi:HNH endonuclease
MSNLSEQVMMKPPVDNPIITRKDQKWIPTAVPLNPSGLCQCGCGEKAPIAESNKRSVGYIKGQPILYIASHVGRRNGPVMYVEEDRGYRTKCFIWQWCLTNRGYGHVNKSKDPSGLAHVYMYRKYVGPIPKGLTLDHLCHVRSCVNPKHLEPVTNAENCRRGDKAKLTWEIVNSMRKMRMETGLSYAKLGKIFGISRWHAWQVCMGKRWIAI